MTRRRTPGPPGPPSPPPEPPPPSRRVTGNAQRLARFHKRQAEGRAPLVKTQPRYARFIQALLASGQLTEGQALDHANVERQATLLIDRWTDEMLQKF